MIGGLAVATLWTGGSALAAVGALARDALTPTATPSGPSSVAVHAAAEAAAAARRRTELDTQRQMLLTQARSLAAAAQGGAAGPLSAETDAASLLDGAEHAVQLRSARLKLALRTLGLKPASLASAEPQAATLVKVSTDNTALGDAVLTDTARRLERVAKDVGAIQRLSASAARLPLAAPVATPVLSSGFGGRSDPFTGLSAFHAGQDFSGVSMTRIDVTAPGVVSFTGERSGYGNTVEVDHGGGFKTRYAHLAAISVRVGQAVALGDKLGGMGSTGRSTGTHLHYEVWVNGVVQNPDRFLRAGQMLAGTEAASVMAKASGPHGRGRLTQVASVVERRSGRVHAHFGG